LLFEGNVDRTQIGEGGGRVVGDYKPILPHRRNKYAQASNIQGNEKGRNPKMNDMYTCVKKSSCIEKPVAINVELFGYKKNRKKISIIFLPLSR
jgi:hypothetical protein